MRIAEIEVFNLRSLYPPDAAFAYARGKCSGRLTSLIRVQTEGGLVGWGSAYSHPALIRIIVEGHLKPLLLGMDSTEVETLWQRMYALTRWYGRKGAAISAIGALDIAFWDLRGKALGKPIRRLLGSDINKVPGYASALLWQDDVEILRDEATRHLEHGFRRMKMRLGRNWDYDRAALAAVRRGATSRAEIMVDGMMAYTLEAAERLGRVCKENQVFWFEEPFTPEDIDNYVALRSRLDMRIASGENEFGLQGFRELLRAGAIDIAQADSSRCGGITEVLRVGEMAAEFGCLLAPHSWSDAIAIMANAQVVASLDNALTVEIDQTKNALVDSLLVEPLRVEDGYLMLSDKPGLGIDVDSKILRELSIPANEEIPEGNYSDLSFGKDFVTFQKVAGEEAG